MPVRLVNALAVLALSSTSLMGLVPAQAQSVVQSPKPQTAVGTFKGAGAGAAIRSGVFRDVNANGFWDADEPGQGGIRVTARCSLPYPGQMPSTEEHVRTLGTAVTADDGSYSLNTFGLCRVEFAIPPDLQSTLQPGPFGASPDDPQDVGSPIDAQYSGSFVQFANSRFDNYMTTSVINPADYPGAPTTLAPVEIGGRLWRDRNRDSVMNPGDLMLEDVVVTMSIAGKTYQATSNNEGDYLFSSVARVGATTVPELDAASYRLDGANLPVTLEVRDVSGPDVQAPLATFAPTQPNVGTNNALDSDGVLSGNRSVITLTLGEATGRSGNDSNATAADAVLGEGFNRHMFDFGFTRRLAMSGLVGYQSRSGGVTAAAWQVLPGVTVSVVGGADGLPVTDVDGAVVADVTTDANGHFTIDNVGAGHYLLVVKGASAELTNEHHVVIGEYGNGMRDATEADGPIKAGQISTMADVWLQWKTYGIGDFAWNDLNRDGLQSPDERAIVPLTVNVFHADGTAVLRADGSAWPSGSTDPYGRGEYLYEGLPSGDYYLAFTGLPPGYVFTQQNVGTNPKLDSDVDPLTGRTGVFTLGQEAPNMRSLTIDDIKNRSRPMVDMLNDTIDVGVVRARFAVGDHVWHDVNGDGVRTDDEAPVGGVTVSLFNANGGTKNAPLVATTSTDANGHYLFNKLAAGKYFVSFSDLPDGLGLTLQSAGSDRTRDSDVDPGSGQSPVFTLALDAPNLRRPVAADGTDVTLINDTVDAGLAVPTLVVTPTPIDTSTTDPTPTDPTPTAEPEPSVTVAPTDASTPEPTAVAAPTGTQGPSPAPYPLPFTGASVAAAGGLAALLLGGGGALLLLARRRRL